MDSKADLYSDVFLGSTAVASGALSEKSLLYGPWRRLFRNVYAHSSLPLDHGVLCRALSLILPDDVVIAGHSAAWLHGAQYRNSRDVVEVLSSYRLGYGPVKGVRVTTGDVQESNTVAFPNIQALVQDLPHTILHIARYNTEEHAVPALDHIARHAPYGRESIRRVLDALPSRSPYPYRAKRARNALLLVNARSESWRESQLRVVLSQTGLNPPAIQHEVRVEGQFIARVDFAWPEQQVAVEYDGAWHSSEHQIRADRRRHKQLAEAGWTVIRVDAESFGRSGRSREAMLAHIASALRG